MTQVPLISPICSSKRSFGCLTLLEDILNSASDETRIKEKTETNDSNGKKIDIHKGFSIFTHKTLKIKYNIGGDKEKHYGLQLYLTLQTKRNEKLIRNHDKKSLNEYDDAFLESLDRVVFVSGIEKARPDKINCTYVRLRKYNLKSEKRVFEYVPAKIFCSEDNRGYVSCQIGSNELFELGDHLLKKAVKSYDLKHICQMYHEEIEPTKSKKSFLKSLTNLFR